MMPGTVCSDLLGIDSMSGPIVRTGTTPAFWNNWDSVFGKGAKAKKGNGATAKKAEPKQAAKKAVKKAPKKG